MPNRKARLAKGSYEGLRKVLVNRRLENKSSRRAVVGVVLALFFSAGTLGAQVTASISGRVEDPSGAAVPGVTVTVTSLETGAARTVTTDAAGTYRALSLSVGRYEVKAAMAGFKAAAQTGINLVLGQEAAVNLKLEVGAVQEQVTVTGEAPVVNTTTASVSGLVGEKQVKDLPLNGRSFDNLITLNPGAINYSALKQGPAAGTSEGAAFTVSGRRPLDNLFLLNGIEYTGSSVVGHTPGGVSGQLLGIDAVREFNVVSDTYGAEYGKRGGAQVSIVTQSGTNQLHGSAFEFLRNDVLDARNFFDQGGIPPFRRNQFGGSLGGPIKKDKMFLYGSYEGFRQRLGISAVAFVPDENARRGLLPIGPNNSLIQAPNLDPRMLPFFQLYPAPNGANLGGGIALSSNSPKQSMREDFGTARFDYNISDKDAFTASATVDDGRNLTPNPIATFGTLARLRSHVITAQETHVFSPQLLNTVRAGFSRAAFTFDSPPLVPLPPNLSFFAGRTPGSLVIGGGGASLVGAVTVTGASLNDNVFNFRNLFSGSDDVQVIRGKHQISLGGWFQRVQVNSNPSQQVGQVIFPSLQTFLQGNASNFQGSPNSTSLYWRSTEGAWYVQDNMQLRSNLTVRVGLRHEFTNGWNEKNGNAAQFITDANGVFQTKTRVGGSVFLQNNARKLFSPRVGLAWDPFGRGKTSVRAGFGMHYTLLDNLSFMLTLNPPSNGIVAFAGDSFPSRIPVIPGAPLPPQCGPGVPAPCTRFRAQGVQANAKTPTILEWNYSIEQQLTPNMSLRVAYVGSHGYHQINVADPNSIPLTTCSDPAGCLAGGISAPAQATRVPQGTQFVPLGTRPNPFLANGFFWLTQGVSFYNALQTDLTKRFSRGLTFRANYTYSKNMDNSSTQVSSLSQNDAQTLLDPRNPLRDYSRSALDFTHQGSVNFGYELPFGQGKRFGNGLSGVADKLVSGWQVNGIATFLSGFSFSPLVGSSRSGNGDVFNPDRPNTNPDFRGSVQPKRVDRFFDPAAFSLPPLGTFGNVGRGVLEGPNLNEFNFSVFKSTLIPIREGARLEFRAEFFNLANRANFGLPNPIVFSGGQVNGSAGRITSTATNSRQIQFGLKLFY